MKKLQLDGREAGDIEELTCYVSKADKNKHLLNIRLVYVNYYGQRHDIAVSVTLAKDRLFEVKCALERLLKPKNDKGISLLIDYMPLGKTYQVSLSEK